MKKLTIKESEVLQEALQLFIEIIEYLEDDIMEEELSVIAHNIADKLNIYLS